MKEERVSKEKRLFFCFFTQNLNTVSFYKYIGKVKLKNRILDGTSSVRDSFMNKNIFGFVAKLQNTRE